MLLEDMGELRVLAEIFAKIFVATFGVEIALNSPDAEAVSCSLFLNLLL